MKHSYPFQVLIKQTKKKKVAVLFRYSVKRWLSFSDMHYIVIIFIFHKQGYMYVISVSKIRRNVQLYIVLPEGSAVSNHLTCILQLPYLTRQLPLMFECTCLPLIPLDVTFCNYMLLITDILQRRGSLSRCSQLLQQADCLSKHFFFYMNIAFSVFLLNIFSEQLSRCVVSFRIDLVVVFQWSWWWRQCWWFCWCFTEGYHWCRNELSLPTLPPHPLRIQG